MTTLAAVLSLLSGLYFIAPGLPDDVTIATAVAMQITHAIICRVFAGQRGRSGLRWGIAGFLGGVVTTTALLIIVEREGDLEPST